ncbi:hypothetical protein SEVIR_4G137200v4 [Setaria viridis]|uniref:Uncharacterized protein n=2 Tax=Setaria TaxID=4554 RepID=K3Y3A3_SETIT|nr:uncharacterized protein LOC101764328 [Setaria italica]XP_034591404.1 uncharacterized protein LOC117853140 [Setaria viridis]RCV21827.1 hypothetical protein SETIT_4G169100v2 [Setaria italica]TKW21695.1 hypothetical protein SEVIR_4G137200v2 [Setaria viridis]
MAQPFSSSSSFAPRRPPPPAFSPSASTSRTSASHVPVCGPRRRAIAATASLHLGPGEVAELARNKVLIAATMASAIGQLSKPFTSGKNGGTGSGLDLKTVFRSGGMPSTHSASVVAVATSLGLERGFADSVFGMSVVFAAIVMYDAQGVRREVGNHAKVLNKFWILREKVPQDSELDMASEFVSVTEEVISSNRSNASPSPRRSSRAESPRLNRLRSSEPDVTDLTEVNSSYIEEGYLLSESVGHTELQVTVGALLGFIVSLAVYATL